MPFKKISTFWQKYVTGEISCLSQFKEAKRQQMQIEQADPQSADRFTGAITDIAAHKGFDRLRAKHIISSEMMLRYHDRADWQNTQKDIRRFAAAFIEACRKYNVPMYVHGAFRTQSEQDHLRKTGRSKAYYPRAPHCQGAAVDIVHGVHHWDLTKGEWDRIGILGKEVARKLGIEITWGGDWSFYDPAHWELKGWQNNIREPIAGEPVRYTPRTLAKL
jgi:hypothetical protein